MFNLNLLKGAPGPALAGQPLGLVRLAVPSAGVEPTSTVSKTVTLSVKLRGRAYFMFISSLIISYFFALGNTQI